MGYNNTSRLETLFLVIANLLIPVSIIIFATGFFPYKPFLSGLAQYEALEYGSPPAAPFDRLVFMVVDALRSLIRRGHALPFTANARSPTITMPRIKAITTGSIPSFLDVILNFDEGDTSSTLAAQDTWLAQMKAKKSGKMVMYGDDTWLKLFPDTFDRADGTSSFFVSDFTEVDNNVTRHVPDELRNKDWSTMVLHYLGLDHIGHKAGPSSPNMVPKQREMDALVKEIYNAIESHDHLASTLLVLCGDHGMNDAGNHGASSPGETSPALVFISPKLSAISSNMNLESPTSYRDDFNYYSKVEQSDIAPTLGALLGFPVPRNNLGALIQEFLPFWSKRDDQIQLLVRNARQILTIFEATFGADLLEQSQDESACRDPEDEPLGLACEWQRIDTQRQSFKDDSPIDSEWVSAISKWLGRAQDLMSNMASNYDMPRLIGGQAFIFVALVSNALLLKVCWSHTPFVIMTISYGIMMFASSFVEEEHHFWYWATSAWFGGLGIVQLRNTKQPFSRALQLSLALLSTRLVRAWNQTGQKHAGEPDIVKTFLMASPLTLWALVGATYALLGIPLTFKLAFTREDAPELLGGFVHDISAALQRLTLVTRARIVFLDLAAVAAYALSKSVAEPSSAMSMAELLHYLYALLAATQSRVTNIPLLLLFEVQYTFLASLDLDVTTISTTSILLQYMSFFAFGGTNAISSVDLSSAYNGVSGFNVVGVGFLTFISNWAGPVYWTSATNLLLLQRSRGRPDSSVLFRHLTNVTLFATCSVAFIMAACTALRTHLFIWTVFSPKYLYCMAWGIGQHLFINILLASGLYWMGAPS
ncbi:major facilitator super transporter protein [Verticillium nonalfalfae]|uniref:GPI ethanolamine phosphate transferase 2 n=1 Tax=Verticillium nonalfalfae TaxID=1051616 RepID=A0A3M9Y505_9PEZI|nr:major facilitator super transporter protein [Verticillium nonalfalfae]RNJ55384.1 major facilitator super transporter protein [Verticillium nonalfalfae]